MSDAIALPARSRHPTMIKGLIPTLPERGKIKIGMKGEVRKSQRGTEFQPPQKLDHFIVTTLQRGADGNFIPDETLMRRLGDKPTEIPVRLLYDDPTLNFPTRYACFSGRSLWCSGDGEVAIRATPSGPQEVACTCERADPAYKGNDKCKMNGSLSVLIEGAGGIGGVWKFRTTSYNSIVGIMSTMAFIRSMTGGVLANIPLKLRVQPKQATAPDGNPVTIYFVSLEFDGDMPGLQALAHGIALDRAKMNVSIEHIEEEAKRLLALAPPANVPLAGDDADDVVEEFYPEQIAPQSGATRADLDAFAGIKPAEVIDGETGEVLDAPAFERTARTVAAEGWKALSTYLKDIPETVYDGLRPLIGTRDEPGELRQIARQADERAAAQDSPPGPSQPQAVGTDDSLPQSSNTNRQPGGEPINDLLGGKARPATGKYHFKMSRVPTDNECNHLNDRVDGWLSDGVDPALILADNAENIENLRKCDPDYHAELMRKLGSRDA